MKSLLGGRKDAVIKLEKGLLLNGRKWFPDLAVYCESTGALLLAIEVWHTHAVSGRKHASYLAAGIPWIEVKAWNVLERIGKKTVSVLDWGAIAGVRSPFQGQLFEEAAPKSRSIKAHQRVAFNVRSSDWPMPPAAKFTFGAPKDGELIQPK